MALGEYENRIWEEQIAHLEDLHADFRPVSLKVSGVLESPMDFWYAIEENMAKRHLDSEDADMVARFLGDVLHSGNPRAIIAELPYIETEDGLQVQLVFPVDKGLRE